MALSTSQTSIQEQLKCNNSTYNRSILPNHGPHHILIQSQSKSQAQTDIRSQLLALPSELLTIILSHALDAARLCPRCRVTHPLNHMLCQHPYTVTGVSSFPLLFVNWQLHRELLDLVYANITLGIAGYYLCDETLAKTAGLKERNESGLGMANWVRSRTLREHVRKVTLSFSPCEHGSRLSKWGVEHNRKFIPFNIVSTSPEIISELVGHLKTFQVLEEVVVRLEVTRNQLHIASGDLVEGVVREEHLDGLLPLFGIEGVGGKVCVGMVMSGTPAMRNKWRAKVGELAGRMREDVGEWAKLRAVGFGI